MVLSTTMCTAKLLCTVAMCQQKAFIVKGGLVCMGIHLQGYASYQTPIRFTKLHSGFLI